ncbi:30S ribosomal protein S26e [Marine Group I thaumarchaeote SCGC AAA799-B03]|uniref:30S ribosomal protein S26e n=1 Tax=Marine Group I thaumarchaeote SCGC AAA799-B03 TaxID=1502289 RepID=A0A087S694_9ARCH|nr:30S ribosomal protein S26e [Marine Group I thaumarchaeote SCGC AAA799-B03]
MPLKRASRGRTKGGKGSSGVVQCTNCGQTVPKDKAKKVTSRLNLVEHTLAKELRAQGAYIASPTVLKWYCISCAIHFKILKIRSADNRRKLKQIISYHLIVYRNKRKLKNERLM